ncbi:LysR family transcriptional regulator [Vogesella indigofera]|uniref:LysR family transcriptional regulator n=1 Tax=Vogesella indigofera TaxID=45465 RepID=UPI00234F33AC|nr:LysR family transcriptional regulator [Vogesella indigofera]MDC7701434.1 LysR family transcriptional regulator [Vogesella indigofera]
MNEFDLDADALRRLDLNLLLAFDVLMQERHVSRAAARLYLGQPAMSHALARLRKLLDDPLFIRCGSRMEPTARALALAPAVHAWLQEANRFLFRQPPFDPAAVNASLRLSMPDGMEAMLYPSLIAALRQQAPQLQLRSQLLETDQQLAALDNDEVDLLITAAPLPLRDWHSRRPLFDSGFCSVHSTQQLVLSATPSLAELAACDHVVSSYRGTAAGVIDHLFAGHGLARRIVALAASLMAIAHILQQAPLVSIQPALYHSLFDLHPALRCSPLPGAAQIQIDLVWHRRNDGHPLHRFLRQVLLAQLQQLFAAEMAAGQATPLQR